MLRNEEAAFYWGEFVPVYADNQLLSFIRQSPQHVRFLIILNFTHRPCYFKTDAVQFEGTIVLSTAPEFEGRFVSGVIPLEADQGMIIKLV
jgi:alpha-glucosidase